MRITFDFNVDDEFGVIHAVSTNQEAWDQTVWEVSFPDSEEPFEHYLWSDVVDMMRRAAPIA